MPDMFSTKLLGLRETALRVAGEIAPFATQVDSEAAWPARSMAALSKAGLMGLQVPEQLGGHGQGLLALAVLTETLGQACPSSALCFGMHCVGTAVIAAKATSYQSGHYLSQIARGEHITTLALSESGTGANFYLSDTRITLGADRFLVNGTKQFVTNGGHADSYVVSALTPDSGEIGDVSCLIVDRDAVGIEWLEPWHGFGMRGNSSRGMRLHDAQVPLANLLGDPGDQIWYVFEVIAPYFLMAMAGSYLGIAQSALEAVGEHMRTRRYNHTGESLRHLDHLQMKYADMWRSVEKTRQLLYAAGERGDCGDPEALPFILSCKADAAETAVAVSNEAMTICGGIAYRENSRVSQMLRDARAGHVMAPTTDMLKIWAGRSLLGLPLL
ncbi:acyl-CoA dehydrogenase [Massilia sp. CCM 8694]|uniref:Acyl-CoA dehydrogenase n=2 Tax=Massilia genomosp. 1 TaxID=2609280 RepID=A0ABX0MR21_9BURK|nr:acyl-CoA dehydrogenase [Massilia genomosp. 1]